LHRPQEQAHAVPERVFLGEVGGSHGQLVSKHRVVDAQTTRAWRHPEPEAVLGRLAPWDRGPGIGVERADVAEMTFVLPNQVAARGPHRNHELDVAMVRIDRQLQRDHEPMLAAKAGVQRVAKVGQGRRILGVRVTGGTAAES
jgi:hypothetical protein